MEKSFHERKILDSLMIAATLLICLDILLPTTSASTYASLSMQPSITVATPPVYLQPGTTGTSIIYANSTTAKIRAAAPTPTPTYTPSNYNVVNGSYLSGTVPASLQTVDSDYFSVNSSGTTASTTAYNPSNSSLNGNTSIVSGTTDDLALNDNVYMTFRSHASQTSVQTLYAHNETTTIGGQNYFYNHLTSADTAGTNLSTPMNSTGRKLLGGFVYQLAGVSSIPSDTWTVYYRAWQTTAAISFDAVGSGSSDGGSSFSWSHTTGSGSNRIMVAGISIRTATVSVSNITYGTQSLTFLRADTHASSTIRSELWYLVAPNPGTYTVAVNLQGGTSKATGGSCTYTGVDQTSPIDVNGGSTGTSSSPSQNVAVNTGNAWLLGHVAVSGSGPNIQSEGTGQTQRWDVVTGQGAQIGRNRGHGSNKGPVGTGSQTMSWTLATSGDWAVSVVVLKSAFSAVGHTDVDVLVRQSDGTTRQTIATDVAPSANLPTTAATLSGTCSWSDYTVVAQSDYLEIDYYTHITTASSASTACLCIDDNTLSTINQTRVQNVALPSEFTSEVEFTGSSNTQNWFQLIGTADSAWTTSSVFVTIQIYDYVLNQYPTSGSGCDSYTSSLTPNTDETRTQAIAMNASNFGDASGNWKIRVRGVKTTATQFDFKADWTEFKPSHYTGYMASTEFQFTSLTTNTPTQLNFTVVGDHDPTNVNVTVQLWNYSSSAYVTSGEGYENHVSTSSNETTLLIAVTNPSFFTSNGNAKIKITSTSATMVKFQQKTNQLRLVYNYDSSPTYDYVLAVVNQGSSSWVINLQVYESSNTGRLTNATITLHDGTSSDQIIVNEGNITQSQGTSHNLPGGAGSTLYIGISNLQATSADTSYLDVYLKVLVPNKMIFSLYVITFEIT